MKTVALTLFLALAAALSAWLAGASPVPPARALQSVSPDAGSRVEIDELRSSISEIADRLARLELRSDVPPTPRVAAAATSSAVPVDVESRLASLRAELASTRAAVEALTLARCDHGDGVGFEGRAQLELKPETDWSAWEEVAYEWRTDRERARRSVLFLGPADVLARFGPPTRIGKEEDVLSWSYGRRAPGGGWDLRAELSLADGYVTSLSMYAP